MIFHYFVEGKTERRLVEVIKENKYIFWKNKKNKLTSREDTKYYF
ncbi:hypothetical protein [Fusobacterium nucleatum]